MIVLTTPEYVPVKPVSTLKLLSLSPLLFNLTIPFTTTPWYWPKPPPTKILPLGWTVKETTSESVNWPGKTPLNPLPTLKLVSLSPLLFNLIILLADNPW